jgi:NAD(P)-dependent dehydrogenase (short-subunit alcohol dehydrogenase family)
VVSYASSKEGADAVVCAVGRAVAPAGDVTKAGQAQPDDIADVAVFLASDEARWMTGERLMASGGFR